MFKLSTLRRLACEWNDRRRFKKCLEGGERVVGRYDGTNKGVDLPVVRRGGAVEGRKKGDGTWAGRARRASSALTLLEGPASVI